MRRWRLCVLAALLTPPIFGCHIVSVNRKYTCKPKGSALKSNLREDMESRDDGQPYAEAVNRNEPDKEASAVLFQRKYRLVKQRTRTSGLRAQRQPWRRQDSQGESWTKRLWNKLCWENEDVEDMEDIHDYDKAIPGVESYQGCECGDHDLTDSRRPWMATAHIKVQDAYSQEWTEKQCGAVIVNRLFLISAASCYCGSLLNCDEDARGLAKSIQDLDNHINTEGPRVHIQVASHLGSRPPDTNSNGFSVRQVVVHEDFSVAPDGTPGHSNLALLRLSRPLQLDRKQAWPICLPPPSTEEEEDKKGISVELVRAQQGDGSMVDSRRQKEEEQIKEFDCDYRSTTVGRKVGDYEDVANCPHKGSFTTGFEGWRERSSSSKKHGFPCRTNHLGPRIFKDCQSECHASTPPPALHPGCVDRGTGQPLLEQSAAEERLPNLVLGRTRRIMVVDGNEWFYCVPGGNHEQSQDQPGGYRGWCDVCMTRKESVEECKEKGRMSWGYCLPECDYKTKQESGDMKGREEEGGRLREVETAAFTSAPHPEGNMSCPGHPEKEFCTGQAFFSPMTQTYRLRQADGQYEYRLSAVAKRFEPRRVKAKTCFGEAGGSVWRMEGRRIYLTGLISRPEDTCGLFGADSNPQRVINTRVSSFVKWITDRIFDGVCQPGDGAE